MTSPLLWPSKNLDFQAYLDWTKDLITSRRLDISTDEALNYRIYKANLPFEYVPSEVIKPRRGILLLHGLLSCPLSMQDIAPHFQQQGFLVRSLLLPGHGTQPTDLRLVTVEDWIQSVEWGIESLKASGIEEIWLGGLSGGASLALYQGCVRKDIQGLVLFAPSITLKNPLVPLSPFLDRLCKLIHFNYWPEKAKENDYAKYNSFPIEFATQAYLLTQLLTDILEKNPPQCPIWMALTADDETICSEAALRVFEKTTDPQNRLFWYAKNASPEGQDKRIVYRSSAYPEQRIIDFSHACLTFSALNFHYGHQGDFGSLLNHPHRFKGATHKENIKRYPLHRLLYNPDFDYMINDIIDFITPTQTDTIKNLSKDTQSSNTTVI